MTQNPTTNLILLAPSAIERSPTNPRKTFPKDKLDELAASVKAKGIISPPTVRPHVGGTAPYQLVVGERRWRAAKLAKLETMPVFVRELSDQEVLELQLIENAQREDVHPLEEADGYEALISQHGYDVDKIATKTGKSASTIYARLKLCALAEYPREAFLEGRLNASIALLIARIADDQLQTRATKDVLGETTFENLEDEETRVGAELMADIDDPNSPLELSRRRLIADGAEGEHITEPLPMSVREAQIHLQRRYMLRLALAKFDAADQNLVPAAGSCLACEFRTGNQRELFADVANADVCTKPSCFERKTQAAWEIKSAAAEAAGLKVIDAEDAARVFTPSAQVRATSPYIDPKSTVPLDLLPAGTTKAPTFEKLLGKKLLDQATKVLVQDPSGAGHELLDRKAVVEVLREAGKIDKPLRPSKSSSSSSSGKGGDPYKEQQEKEQKKREQWTRALRASLLEVVEKPALIFAPSAKWWKWALESVAATTRVDHIVGVEGEVDDLIAKKKLAPEMLLTLMLLNDQGRVPIDEKQTVWRDPGKEEELQAGLELLGVDYDAHLERIKASDKEAAKAEKKIAATKGLTEKCGKCGRELGEHDGKKCPPKKKGGAK